jgi:hypothetical protein
VGTVRVFLILLASQLAACGLVSDQSDGAYSHLSGAEGEDATVDSTFEETSTPEAGPTTDGAPPDPSDAVHDVVIDPACTFKGFSAGSSCPGGLGSSISDWEWRLPCGIPGGDAAATPDCSLCDKGPTWLDATPWPKATSCEYAYGDADWQFLRCHAPCP